MVGPGTVISVFLGSSLDLSFLASLALSTSSSSGGSLLVALNGSLASLPGSLPDGWNECFFLIFVPSLSSSGESLLTLVCAFPVNVAFNVPVRRHEELDQVSSLESSSSSVPVRLGGSVTCLSRLASFLGAFNLEALSVLTSVCICDIVGNGSLAVFLMVWAKSTM